MPFMTFDIYYLVLVLPMLLFSFICSLAVNGTFSRYAKVMTKRGITGAAAAEQVCRMEGAVNVRVGQVPGKLTDHYDPRNSTISLSDTVYGSASVAAVAVAAHEAGHAGQYANHYGPVRLRMSIVPICNFGSMLSMPLVILGFALGYDWLINFGILLFSLVFLFQVITLPVEFNASRRAMRALEQGTLLDATELKLARKVLTAAAMTYVAAMAVSMAQLVRLVLLSNRRRR